MTVKQFNNIYKFQVGDISTVCYNSILKRKAGYKNSEIEPKTELIIKFLYLRAIHKMNTLKQDHETLFLPY